MREKLHLTLSKKWFKMIAAGEKKEEYRELKPYWITRLAIMYIKNSLFYPRQFNWVEAKNGYRRNSPTLIWKHEGIRIGRPNPKWCEPEDVGKMVFILDIGQVEVL